LNSEVRFYYHEAQRAAIVLTSLRSTNSSFSTRYPEILPATSFDFSSSTVS